MVTSFLSMGVWLFEPPTHIDYVSKSSKSDLGFERNALYKFVVVKIKLKGLSSGGLNQVC
jgi:hypothetical protein